MDKFKQFYAQAMADDAVKAEVQKILGETSIDKATDEQLIKLGKLAKTLGIDISLEEAKAYLSKSHDGEGEISANELQAVAGGKGGDSPSTPPDGVGDEDGMDYLHDF